MHTPTFRTGWTWPLACLALITSLGLGAPMAWAQNVAIVNGKAVPKSLLGPARERIMALMAGSTQTLPESELERLARDRVVMDEVLVQAAVTRGLAPASARPGARLGAPQTEPARQQLIDALNADFTAKHPITDAAMQAEYTKLRAMAAETLQYRARHILVADQQQAQALIRQLKRGARFESLARRHSTDRATRTKGGDLGFSAADDFMPEFAAALTSLRKGEVHATPVQTEFGFHILKLDNTRPMPLMPFEQVQQEVRHSLEAQQLAQFHRALMERARTDYRFTTNH